MRITYWWPAPVVRFVNASSIVCGLRSAGWSSASGGAEALDHLEHGLWQVLFLDRSLPDLNAEELSQIIRQRFPAVEIVLLESETACSEEERMAMPVWKAPVDESPLPARAAA